MSYEETYSATKDGVVEAMSATRPKPRLMSIAPFDAQGEDGEEVRAVGIKLDDDDFTFVVVVKESDGGMYVTTRDTLYGSVAVA